MIWPGSATSLLFSNVQFYNSKQRGNGQVFHCERKTEDGSDSNLENQFGAVTDRMWSTRGVVKKTSKLQS